MDTGNLKVGDKVTLRTTHSDGSIIAYKASVRRIDPDGYWVEIPQRVRSLRFPPYGGHRYAKFPNK